MLLVITGPLLSFVYFLYAENQVRQEMKEKLENASLQHITIPLADLYWIKNGKEVLLDGKHFDVELFAVSGNQVTLTGLFDSKEDELHRRFTKVMEEEESSLFSDMASFLFIPVYAEAERSLPGVVWEVVFKNYAHYSEKIPAHPVSDIIHPPVA